MADITATLTGQVTITGELTVPMGIVPRGEMEISENGEYNVTNYETANVTVPQPSGSVTITENGEHDVTDYVTADVQVPQPSGSIEITENGTADVAQFAQAMVNVPTGATNVVIGSFTVQATQGSMLVEIPYRGDGFPIALTIYPKDGMYNNTTADGKEWYNAVARAAIGMWCMVKADTKTPPTYRGGNKAQDWASILFFYKGSTATSYSPSYVIPAYIFRDSAPYSSNEMCVIFNSKTKMYIYAKGSSSGFGFRSGQTYEYIATYSE